MPFETQLVAGREEDRDVLRSVVGIVKGGGKVPKKLKVSEEHYMTWVGSNPSEETFFETSGRFVRCYQESN